MKNTEVSRTRQELQSALAVCPEKPYSLCTASDKAKYDAVKAAADAHREAVHASRKTLTSSQHENPHTHTRRASEIKPSGLPRPTTSLHPSR